MVDDLDGLDGPKIGDYPQGVSGVVSPLRHAKPQRMLDPKNATPYLRRLQYRFTMDHIEALPEGWHTSADT